MYLIYYYAYTMNIMHTEYVYRVCIQSMHTEYIYRVCIQSMYTEYAYRVCIQSMYILRYTLCVYKRSTSSPPSSSSSSSSSASVSLSVFKQSFNISRDFLCFYVVLCTVTGVKQPVRGCEQGCPHLFRAGAR